MSNLSNEIMTLLLMEVEEINSKSLGIKRDLPVKERFMTRKFKPNRTEDCVHNDVVDQSVNQKY